MQRLALVNQPSEHRLDAEHGRERRRTLTRAAVLGLVVAMLVVMADVDGEDSFEVTAVHD